MMSASASRATRNDQMAKMTVPGIAVSLIAGLLWLFVADAGAQEEAPPPADSTWHAPEEETAPAEAGADTDESAEPEPAGEDTPAAAEDETEEEATDEEKLPPLTDEDSDFVPSEAIRADSALSFPSDI